MLLKPALCESTRRSPRTNPISLKTFVILSLPIALASWLGYRAILSHYQTPQALLVLGGAHQREIFAADFARSHPQLPVWVSGGSNPEYSEWVFAEAGIAPDRVHLDYQAVDTVTNFTTLADKLRSQGIQSVYLITSDYHMRRACVIGEIVFGSRGIGFKPIPVRSGQPPEPLFKVIRDGARSILWVTTGYTGSSLKSDRKSDLELR
jgi:uncharacterized SAM-binding protein YcdF (DUF218 family)